MAPFKTERCLFLTKSVEDLFIFRAKKKYFKAAPLVSEGLDGRFPSYLKISIRYRNYFLIHRFFVAQNM